ncbi:hypothetical protein BWD09_07025 [Neisseria dentiae]|uniref:Uncharacterized protein n=2 Tax=Neisseria dentiae TaxID=194197 RepID=A0A1X3D9V6_9NEIS|nr:hypothetical protein BWD09_07025 [Neisseria dentiae]
MAACKSSTILPTAINPPPADLAQPCQKIPKLQGKTGGEVLPYILSLHSIYKDCSEKQAGLVKAWPK